MEATKSKKSQGLLNLGTKDIISMVGFPRFLLLSAQNLASETDRLITNIQFGIKINQLKKDEDEALKAEHPQDDEPIDEETKVEKAEVRVVNNPTTEQIEEGFFSFTDEILDRNIKEAIESMPDIDPRKIKLTILAILYVGMVISPEQVYKRISTEQIGMQLDLEFLNTVIKFFSGIVFYPSANSYMINDEFEDISHLNRIVSYESQWEEFPKYNDALDTVINKTRDLIMEHDRKTQKAHGVEDPDPIVPFLFVNNNMDLTKPQKISKQMLQQLEKAFGDLLSPYQYQFNRINDIVELVIYSDGRMDSYIIDPGYVIGNGYNIIYPYNNVSLIINLKHTEVVQKILANRYAQLTPEEIQLVNQDLFMNGYIYHMIDMSKGPEILPKLTQEEFYNLGKKLSAVLNLEWSENGGIDGKILKSRLRFKSFKSINDFVLVSDSKCKSPMNWNYNIITDGLTVKVKDNTITVKLEDYSKTYEVNYNEM